MGKSAPRLSVMISGIFMGIAGCAEKAPAG
jgi:hypothetical protein